ncbi:murein biosynthesis integral membrane protein MurJ [candidate division KSB1 bacterium]|nr:murein biosynthesis integral membrane protein MurJ [candidate division KSB1 bacterium]
MSRRIFKNLIDLISGTMFSRVMGFLRELVTASYFGTGRGMDLFVIAFTIPTFFRHFLGEDVVERAFMPPFKRLLSQGNYKTAWRLLSSCFNVMLLLLIFFTFILYFCAPLIIMFLAPGLDTKLMPVAINMTYWILPFMVIIGMAAFVGGILNFFEQNKIYSFAPAMLSVGIIIGIIFFKPMLEKNGFSGIYALPAGFLLGGLLELIIQIPFIFKKEIRVDTQASFSWKINYKEKEFRNVGRESGFITLRSLLDKSIEIIDRRLASFLITGSIASLWYAQRLIQLPVAIIGLSISRALVPYLTERRALTQEDDFLNGIKLGIRLNFYLTVPAIMLMVLMSEPIINIVYRRGAFNAESVRLTSIAFWCYSLGLLGMGLNTFFSQIFSIFQKNKIPFYTFAVATVINITLKFVLVKTPLKHGGIALASSIAFTLYGICLFYFLKRELKQQITFFYLWQQFYPVTLVCILIGGGVYGLYQGALLPLIEPLHLSIFLKNLLYLMVSAALCLFLFGIYVFRWGPADVKLRLQKMLHR